MNYEKYKKMSKEKQKEYDYKKQNSTESLILTFFIYIIIFIVSLLFEIGNKNVPKIYYIGILIIMILVFIMMFKELIPYLKFKVTKK